VNKARPPDELPVILQVLLSQVHRVHGLELWAKFVDLGAWAVGAALSVGIFPYVLKLLQSGSRDVRGPLAFIWAKILWVDPERQQELVKGKKFRPYLLSFGLKFLFKTWKPKINVGFFP
jgi:regulator-associated protein of mTOR